MFDRIAARLPNTVVFVLGPWRPYNGDTSDRDGIKAAVGSRPNFFFVDNVAENWQTGNSTVAHPNGSGNNDAYLSSDGIHPTLTGHKYLAGLLARDLRAIIGTF